MSLSQDEIINVLSTKIFLGKDAHLNQLEVQRKKRLKEAIKWKKGTPKAPKKYVVNALEDGLEVYFLKPGKETTRTKPNIYDLKPKVGESYFNAKFSDLWIRLAKISFSDYEAFRQILVLIYRVAYHVDHIQTEKGEIRYRPNRELMQCIHTIQEKIGHELPPGGLLGFLNFLDILGWNEDLKYHANHGGPPEYYDKTKPKAGRINTLLSCINVSYQTNQFVKNVLENQKNLDKLEWSLINDLFQTFARSRGICAPTYKNITDWLSPYITKS